MSGYAENLRAWRRRQGVLPLMPAAPLVAEIERFLRTQPAPQDAHEQSPRWILANRYVAWHGGKVESVKRQVDRVMAGTVASVSCDFADRLCLALGTHPALVYGPEWNVEES